MSDPKLRAYLQECVLQCPLCSNEYTDPKTLECLHTFCLQCIDDHVSQTQADGRFACPTCSNEQEVPEGGSADLDTSYINQSVQKLSKLMQSEDTLCTSCAENTAETACYNCGEFLCPDCGEKHSILKATREHEVCPVGDLLIGENLVKFQRERFDNCSKHGELRKLYCRKCDVALCNVCVYDDRHQKHDVTSIHSKVDDEIKVVEKKMEVLHKDQEGHTSNIEALQEKLTSAQANQGEVVSSIEAYAQQMHDLVDQYKAALISQVTAEATNQQSDLQTKIIVHQNQMNRKVKLIRDCSILEELPLGNILPASEELKRNVEKCKRPYAITRQQLDRANPDQGFIGRDEEMTQEAIDSNLKSLIGYLTPLPESRDRALHIIDNDMKESMEKQAIDTCNSVISQHSSNPRGLATFKAMAKDILDRWREKHRGDWKCFIGASGMSGKAGFSKKKSDTNLRIDIEGFEIHMFQMAESSHK